MAFLLSHSPIPLHTPDFDPGLGAEARFLGVVREFEGEARLSGIEYSVYLPMAEKMLSRLLDAVRLEHGTHEVFIQHRLGMVRAGEPSILIRVRSRHSALAFELCALYLREIKTKVPIWKKPILAEV